MVSFLLTTFTLATIETINIIRANIYIHKIAREGAREAAIFSDIVAGKSMADDAAKQYFVASKPTIALYKNQVAGKTSNVVCDVSYNYKPFYFLNNNGLGGIELNAKATYPWWDENT